jgi:class 3 adenylate cyclase
LRAERGVCPKRGVCPTRGVKRVAGSCGVASGEVLVSRTVKDLVAGSGLRFEDRGEHPLKGIPDVSHLFALAPG